jgi:hypothetical protein
MEKIFFFGNIWIAVASERKDVFDTAFSKLLYKVVYFITTVIYTGKMDQQIYVVLFFYFFCEFNRSVVCGTAGGPKSYADKIGMAVSQNL